MGKAVIYARQSLDRTGEALAVSRQLEECRTLAERHGLTVAAEYVDNDTSASTGKPRPEWTRLLRDLDGGGVDVLICWHTDRLYRRLRDLVELLELAEANRLRILSVRAADLDLSTPAGRMLAGMLGSAARYEAEQKGTRQKAANRQRANAGHVGWTRRPYGYEVQDGRIEVVPGEADELRDAARRVLAGDTLAGIVRSLNDRAVPTSTGGRWTVNTLKRLLTSPRHAGRAVYNGADVGPGAWEPIFDPDTMERLTAALTDPQRLTHSGNGVKYLLSGLAECGRCGRPLYASPTGVKGQRYNVYRCHTPHLTRRLDLVDGVVEAHVLGRLTQPDALDLLSPSEDVSALAAESREIRERLDGLAGLYADGVLDAGSVREQSTRLRERLSELQGRITSAGAGGDLAALVSAGDVAAHWQGMAIRPRRAVVDALITVTVLPVHRGARFTADQVRVDWKA